MKRLMKRLGDVLLALNAWQERDLAPTLIAAAIRAAAPRCEAEIHPAGCLQCTLARQAERDAAIASGWVAR